MAFYEKRGKRWRAQIRRGGHNISKSFATKRDAEIWASDIELQIERGGFYPNWGIGGNITLFDILQQYINEVTPTKKSARSERYRLKRFMAHEVAKIPLNKLTRSNIAQWKEERQNSVSDATVLREWNNISSAYEHAVKVWGYELPDNPFKQIRRPKGGKPRNQRITDDDIDEIIKALGYERGKVPIQKKELVAWCFLFAIETAMRAGEILKLMPVTLPLNMYHILVEFRHHYAAKFANFEGGR